MLPPGPDLYAQVAGQPPRHQVNAVTFASNGGGSSNTLTGRAVTSPTLQAQPFNGTNFVFAFETVLGFTYGVHYKDSLTDLVWQRLTSVAGDGTIQRISVPVTSPAQRFYRLRVE
jgi:hypothetical protein